MTWRFRNMLAQPARPRSPARNEWRTSVRRFSLQEMRHADVAPESCVLNSLANAVVRSHPRFGEMTMNTLLLSLNSYLVWNWQSTSMSEYLWTIIGLLATGWFLATLRRA